MKMQVKINDQTFDVEISDLQSRPIVAVVDGETFEVWPEETAQPTAAPAGVLPAAAPAPAAAPVVISAAPVAAATASGGIPSPLPGTVIAIMVREGQVVKRGDELLTLEAMKMKNAIRAPRDGKVGKISVNVGDLVRHGQLLLEFAD